MHLLICECCETSCSTLCGSASALSDARAQRTAEAWPASNRLRILGVSHELATSIIETPAFPATTESGTSYSGNSLRYDHIASEGARSGRLVWPSLKRGRKHQRMVPAVPEDHLSTQRVDAYGASKALLDKPAESVMNRYKYIDTDKAHICTRSTASR